MLRKEWKGLVHNKLLLVVVVAIVLIPTIYTTLFLGSMWDPYGNLDKLPVAVVNEDRAVSYNDRELNVGKELTEKLRDEESLCFNFVDAETAERGLRNGTYYMVITIPEDFSANAATVMDEKPEKMELAYQTNPGTNYIASKMSETAMEKVKNSVAEEVTKTYTQAVFDQIAEVGDGMQEAADGSGDLKAGMDKVSEGNQTITANLKTLADSSLTFREGSETLRVGLKTYVDGVSTVNSGAGQLDSGAAQLKDGVTAAKSGVSELSDGTGTLVSGAWELKDGAGALHTGLSELDGKVPALKEGVDQLAQGTGALADGAVQLEAGGTSLKVGVSNADAAMAELCRGLEVLRESTDTLPDAAEQIHVGAEALVQGTKDLETGSGNLKAGIGQVKAGMEAVNGEGGANSEQLADGALALNQGLEQLYSMLTAGGSGTQASGEATTVQTDVDVSEARQALDILYGQADVLQGKAGELEASADGIGSVNAVSSDGLAAALEAAVASGDIEQVAQAADQAVAAAQENENAVIESNSRLENAAALLRESGTALRGTGEAVSASADDALNALDRVNGQTVTTVETGQASDADTQAMEQVVTVVGKLRDSSRTLADKTAAYTGGVKAVTGNMAALENGALALYEGAGQAKAGAEQLEAGTAELNQKSPLLKAGIGQAAAASEQFRTEAMQPLLYGSDSLLKGITGVSTGAGQVNDGAGALQGKVPELEAGISQLDQGAGSLDRGAGTLADGASRLDDGAKELLRGSGQLLDGAAELKDGTGSLVFGTGELTANNSTLLDGASQLSEGAGAIREGAGKLKDGSAELGDGISQAADGSRTLSSSLQDGARQVKDTKSTDDTVEMFAAPVETSETMITTVENNGHAMAPYMMSVGLWVGCIAFSLMYPLTKYKGKLRSGFSWWLSKASVLYTIAVLQAVAMILLLHVFDGFNPAEMGRTIGFACLASVAFMSVMYFFTNFIGKVGSFLMLVFMVVQLAGSVGTYPLEISGSFVPYLHGWVPFTYSVEAFRSTISGGESIRGAVVFMIILCAVFTLLTLIEFQLRARKIKAGKHILADWLEEKGLA